jgi:glycosyltransferase involved in cell wall biosynthesis
MDPQERQKGFDHTIEAVALLAKEGLEFSLAIVGDGSDRRRLEELASAQGVASRVVFRGRLDDEALKTCYRRCDVFILPSAQEGFGIVYLEAMAYAKPVVAADAGGAPFVVRPGISGSLVPYGDPAALASCLKRLVSDPQASRDLGMRARAFLQQTFSSEQYVSSTENHLRDAKLL